MSKCSVQKLAVRKMSNAYFYIPHMNRKMRDVTNWIYFQRNVLNSVCNIPSSRDFSKANHVDFLLKIGIFSARGIRKPTHFREVSGPAPTLWSDSALENYYSQENISAKVMNIYEKNRTTCSELGSVSNETTGTQHSTVALEYF